MLDNRNITASSRAIAYPLGLQPGIEPYCLKGLSRRTRRWRSHSGLYAAPSRAVDLSGLPPAFIGTGELILFVEEDIDYAQRLIASGDSAEMAVYPRVIHGFDLSAPDAPVSGASSGTASTP